MANKKYKFELFAQDFNSPLKRNYIFTQAFFKSPTMLKLPRFVIGIISRKNDIEYFYDLATWTATHEAIKAKALKDRTYVDQLIETYLVLGKKMNQWSENEIFKKDLTKISNQKLYHLLLQFIDKQGSMYAYGVMLPVLDFLNFSYVESNLKNFLKEKAPSNEFEEYFNVFTYPLHDSFALLQEIALLKLMNKYYSDSAWQKDIINKSSEYIADKYPKFWSDLNKHAKKYGWVYYVYMGPAFGPKEFLEFARDYLNNKIKPAVKLQEIKTERKQIEVKRNKFIKQLKPDIFNLSIIKLAPKMVWAKPMRKDLQSKTYYHLEKLYREIGQRFKLSLNQVQSIPPDDMKKYLVDSQPVNINKINQIFNFHICKPNDDGTVSVLFGVQAEKFLKNLKAQNQLKIKSDLNLIKGTAAFDGQAKGLVKIINKPSDMAKMNRGDILVSVATTPSIVPAMKKAAAIVTDEGGLTCHASIVSRELKIPCLVGTYFASKILKDGDLVEVNTKKGTVRKI